MQTDRILVIVRHAHRSKRWGAETDNGLSEQGKKQAKQVARFFAERFGKRARAVLYSSPKKRCLETLEPLARKLKADVQVHEGLDEGGALGKKIDQFLAEWKEGDAEITVICSHGDWIPVALARACGRMLDLEKGGWAELQGNDLRLTWMVQELG